LLYLATLEELWWSCSPSSSLEILLLLFSKTGGKISQKHHLFFRKKKSITQKKNLNAHNMLFSIYFVAKIHHFGAVLMMSIDDVAQVAIVHKYNKKEKKEAE
jgi:hypothetical protein